MALLITIPMCKVVESLKYYGDRGLVYDNTGVDIRLWLTPKLPKLEDGHYESLTDGAFIDAVIEFLTDVNKDDSVKHWSCGYDKMYTTLNTILSDGGEHSNSGMIIQLAKEGICSLLPDQYHRDMFMFLDDMTIDDIRHFAILSAVAINTFKIGLCDLFYTVDSSGNKVKLSSTSSHVGVDRDGIKWTFVPVVEQTVVGTTRFYGTQTQKYNPTLDLGVIDSLGYAIEDNEYDIVSSILANLGVSFRDDAEVHDTYDIDVENDIDDDDSGIRDIVIDIIGTRIRDGYTINRQSHIPSVRSNMEDIRISLLS